ncbi:hypothetical protein [Acaryochloris marina]|uniref:hypothetical protein n=1 Tax=Acaryochloris marina TaxID=155978 RepID=UPI00164F09E9|nr:hypothetical protein [Acaryochloris marina]
MILILWPFVKPRPFISIILELVMVKRGQRFLDFKRIGEGAVPKCIGLMAGWPGIA